MKALIFIIIALNLVSCNTVGNKSVSDLSSEPTTVSVIKVQEAENEAKWNYVGNVEPSKDVIINSSAVGTLVELNARKGQQVKKGDILGIVDSEQVRSAYDITKSNLLLAQDGYERAQQTFASGSITEQKFMEIKSQLTKAQASERIAKKGLDNCTIKAPFDGVINKVFAENGIEVSIASPIVRILNIDHVEIHFPVPENEISSIYVGQKVCVEIPALKRTTEGSIVVKGHTASPLSHTYDCIAHIDNTNGLLPGMVCTVNVEAESASGITIPAHCVMTDMRGRYVWRVNGDTVEKSYIIVSGYSSNDIVVSDGLTIGDLVIVEGRRKVSSGMKVNVEVR